LALELKRAPFGESEELAKTGIAAKYLKRFSTAGSYYEITPGLIKSLWLTFKIK